MSGGGRFSSLLLEGLDHYRKGKMLDAVRAWEEAYLLEPTNLRAREFLRSALERIHAHMTPLNAQPGPGAHPWLPAEKPQPDKTQAFSLPPPPPPPAPPASAAAKAPPAKAKPANAAKPPPARKGAPLPASLPELPRTPWDDGPSVAIPQAEVPGDATGGAWSIHKEPRPSDGAVDDEAQVWMRGARELVALNDFSGALELLNKLLEKKPGDNDAAQLLDVCEHNLTLMYESKIGAMDARPRTAIPPDEIIWLNLDPRAGFVLAQIDGEVSFDDLYAICGLKRLDTARILCELLEQGVVQVQGREAVVAKRTIRPT